MPSCHPPHATYCRECGYPADEKEPMMPVSAGISDECRRCGGEMSHDGSALDLLGYCLPCGEQVQRDYLARFGGAA